MSLGKILHRSGDSRWACFVASASYVSGTTIASVVVAGFRLAVSGWKEGIEMRFPILVTTLCLAGGLASAATFTGRLMDADCYNQNRVATNEEGHKTYHSITKTCAPTSSTTSFAVRVTGNPYEEYLGTTIKLDDSGNTQAASEIESGALKMTKHGTMRVKVSGKLRGEVLESAVITPRGGRNAIVSNANAPNANDSNQNNFSSAGK